MLIKIILTGIVVTAASLSCFAQQDQKPDTSEKREKIVIEKLLSRQAIPASFPGNQKGWNEYLQKTLNANTPVDNGAPSGIYTVVVSFLVDKNGKISKVKAENNPGFGTAKEAISVIKNGPDWEPATIDGKPVVYRQRQSISFHVSD